MRIVFGALLKVNLAIVRERRQAIGHIPQARSDVA